MPTIDAMSAFGSTSGTPSFLFGLALELLREMDRVYHGRDGGEEVDDLDCGG